MAAEQFEGEEPARRRPVVRRHQPRWAADASGGGSTSPGETHPAKVPAVVDRRFVLRHRRPAGAGAPRRRWPLVVGTVASGLLLAGCTDPSFEAFRPRDEQGQATFHLWVGLVIAALAVGAIVLALILWAAFAYRAKKTDDTKTLPRQTHQNLPWEVAYTVTPIIIVAVVFFFTVRAENKVDHLVRHPAVKVHVIAYRWGWIFDYTGTPVVVHTTTTSYPTLVLPENETTQITLTSNDVVHEMLVPNFLFGRYAQPGVVNHFDFTPDKLGSFLGHCGVYCGLYHAEMLFYVRVVPPSTFSSWLSSQEAKAQAS